TRTDSDAPRVDAEIRLLRRRTDQGAPVRKSVGGQPQLWRSPSVGIGSESYRRAILRVTTRRPWKLHRGRSACSGPHLPFLRRPNIIFIARCPEPLVAVAHQPVSGSSTWSAWPLTNDNSLFGRKTAGKTSRTGSPS